MKQNIAFVALLGIICLPSSIFKADAAPQNRKNKIQQAGRKVGLNTGQRAAAQSALKTLKRLESATRIGTTFADYSRRLVDTKVSVDESIERVPNGPVKTEIVAAMNEFQNARDPWRLATGDFSEKSLAKLYEEKGITPQKCWARASAHIAKAGQILRKRG